MWPGGKGGIISDTVGKGSVVRHLIAPDGSDAMGNEPRRQQAAAVTTHRAARTTCEARRLHNPVTGRHLFLPRPPWRCAAGV